jgi:hypothetical protein
MDPVLGAADGTVCPGRKLAVAMRQVLPLGAADSLFPLEVHIRTGEMHRLAQYGIACERWVRG